MVVDGTDWSKGRINSENLRSLGIQLIEATKSGLQDGTLNAKMCRVLDIISELGVKSQLSPGETILFLQLMRNHMSVALDSEEIHKIVGLFDKAAVYIFEIYLKSREDIIRRPLLNRRRGESICLLPP